MVAHLGVLGALAQLLGGLGKVGQLEPVGVAGDPVGEQFGHDPARSRQGYGRDQHHAGPTVQQWLRAMRAGRDLLSSRRGGGISRAQGRFAVDKGRGKKQSGLVRFEARGSSLGAWEIADNNWVRFAFLRLLATKHLRARKDATRLVW